MGEEKEVITGAIGICRMCFEPVWESEDSVVSRKSGFYYHSDCAVKVADVEVWERKFRNALRDGML